MQVGKPERVVGMKMSQKVYLSVDCGFDKFKCCINDSCVAFSSKMIDVSKSINALSVGDGNNAYIEYEGVTYEFGDSIDQVLNMQSSLQTYSEFLDAFRNINRFKDRTFYISLLAAIGYSIITYDNNSIQEKDVDKHIFRNLDKTQFNIGIALPYDSMNEWPQIKAFLKQRHQFRIRKGSKACTFDFDLDLTNANFLCNAQVITAFLFQAASSDGSLSIDKKCLPCIMMDAGYKTVGLFELAENLMINPHTALSDTKHAMFNVDQVVAEKVREAGRKDFHYLQVQYHARGEGKPTVRSNKTVIDVKDIYEKVLAEEAYNLCLLLEEKYSLDDVENIFITGGTGIAYYKHIKKYMDEHHGLTKVVLTDRADDGTKVSPMYAIVIGLHKQLKNRYK